MQGYLLAYFFLCFTVGIACLSTTFIAARRRGDALARAFLWFYVSLSLLVMSALLRTFIDMLPSVSPTTRFTVDYFESFVGRYSLMFTLPFFAHRVFAVEKPWLDRMFGLIVVSAAAIQHVTEFWLAKVWDDRGDVFEDVLLAGIIVYVLWLGFARLGDKRVDRPLALRFLVLGLIGLPGFTYDLFLSGDSALRFYPLGYCAISLVMTWYLIRRRPSVRAGSIPAEWGLSEREAEVARLVQRGHSNKDIAGQLNISLNTVKTHLRAVFEKSGVTSRFQLISATQQESLPDSGLEPTNPG